MTFVLPNGVHISEFQPSRDCEVFVYRIPRSVCEQELTSMFEKYGDIYHLRLVQRAEKRHNYAFVRFTNKIAVKVAVLRWNAYEIRMEERISVCRSIENKKLVLFNVPRHLPCQEIKKLISLYTKGLQDVHVFEPKDGKSANTGFAGKSANTGFAGKNANTGLAFLIYDTHICASVAKKTLNATNDFHNYKKPLYVEWYTPGLIWDDSEASFLDGNEIDTSFGYYPVFTAAAEYNLWTTYCYQDSYRYYPESVGVRKYSEFYSGYVDG